MRPGFDEWLVGGKVRTVGVGPSRAPRVPLRAGSGGKPE